MVIKTYVYATLQIQTQINFRNFSATNKGDEKPQIPILP